MPSRIRTQNGFKFPETLRLKDFLEPFEKEKMILSICEPSVQSFELTNEKILFVRPQGVPSDLGQPSNLIFHPLFDQKLYLS